MNGIQVDNCKTVSFTEFPSPLNQVGLYDESSRINLTDTGEKAIAEKTIKDETEQKDLTSSSYPEPAAAVDNPGEEKPDNEADAAMSEERASSEEPARQETKDYDRNYVHEVLVSRDKDPLENVYNDVSDVCNQTVEYNDRKNRQAAEENRNDPDPGKEDDISYIKEEDMTMCYLAFSVERRGKSIGDYELITVPVDRKKPNGRFFYWIKEYSSEKPSIGTSDVVDGFGKFNYSPEGQDFYMVIGTVAGSQEHAVSVFLPKKIGDINIVSNDHYGEGGHVILHEEGTTLHLFPIEFNNDSRTKTASCVCMVERNGSYTPVSTVNGVMNVEANGKKIKLSAAWSDNYTLYSKIA